MEIIDSRYKNFRFTLTDVIADNTSAARHTISTFRVPAKHLDLRTLGVVFEKNGEVVSTAAGAAILGDPAVGLAWLANKLAPFDVTLEPGHMMLSGSFTRPVWAQKGDTLHADFGPLGSVAVQFV